jgi:hypothetical protein
MMSSLLVVVLEGDCQCRGFGEQKMLQEYLQSRMMANAIRIMST